MISNFYFAFMIQLIIIIYILILSVIGINHIFFSKGVTLGEGLSRKVGLEVGMVDREACLVNSKVVIWNNKGLVEAVLPPKAVW